MGQMTAIAATLVLALTFGLAAGASARPFTDKERLLLVDYEYDHAEAMGELYGVTKACKSGFGDFDRSHLAKGVNSSFARVSDILTAAEKKQALVKWEQGREATIASGCNADGVQSMRFAMDRLVADFGEQLSLILKIRHEK